MTVDASDAEIETTKITFFIIQGCGGPDANKPCVFPFQYSGTTYSKCTTKEHDQPWCSTEVDDNGDQVMGKWKNCDSNCGKSKNSFVLLGLCVFCPFLSHTSFIEFDIKYCLTQ